VTTAGNLVDRTAQNLLAGTVEERNKIASSLDASTTSVPIEYSLGSLREQTVFQVDSELMYIWEVNTASKTLTVERGFGGTTAATHADGAIVVVSPKFPRWQILQALNDELADLSSPMNGLFQMKTVDISYNGSDRQINLTGITSMIDVYDVRWRYLSDDYPVVRRYRLMRDMPTSDFPSGYVLSLDEPVMSSTIRVIYKDKYTPFSTEASTLASTGASTELADLLVLGAQIRLLASREVKRNFIESQGDTRRADEVPSGAMNASVTNLLRLRRDRIQAEAARLNRQYPTRIRK
jgi:hypothetical protein